MVLLEPRLQSKVISFRECRHSQNRRHLQRGATAATARIWLADTSNGGAIPPSAAPSCWSAEMQMEPTSRCASKLPGHRDADVVAAPLSCSESCSAAKLQRERP
ncbi:hypothetical protein VPH35_079438 [Triticum aestivum]